MEPKQPVAAGRHATRDSSRRRAVPLAHIQLNAGRGRKDLTDKRWPSSALHRSRADLSASLAATQVTVTAAARTKRQVPQYSYLNDGSPGSNCGANGSRDHECSGAAALQAPSPVL